MDIAALNSTNILRHSVLRWACFCLGGLASVFAVFNLTLNNLPILGYLEVAFALYCFYVFVRLAKHPLQVRQSVAICFTLSFTVVVGTYIAIPTNGLFLWSLVLPTVYYLLLGKNYGFIFSLSLLSALGLVLLTKSSLAPFTSLNLILNLSFAYTIVWAISHAFESSRAQISERLKKLAMLDPLTGAGNRLAMHHYFSVELQERSQLYLFLVDLDYFKQINDQFGHEVGDKVLQETAILLKTSFAKGGVFRVGGEEFALISHFTDEAAALVVAEQVRTAIASKCFAVNGDKIPLTVSIGVAQYQAQQTLTELVSAADELLYKAKEHGRNNVCAASTKKVQSAVA
jgi:diguanylate cyclase